MAPFLRLDRIRHYRSRLFWLLQTHLAVVQRLTNFCTKDFPLVKQPGLLYQVGWVWQLLWNGLLLWNTFLTVRLILQLPLRRHPWLFNCGSNFIIFGTGLSGGCSCWVLGELISRRCLSIAMHRSETQSLWLRDGRKQACRLIIVVWLL